MYWFLTNIHYFCRQYNYFDFVLTTMATRIFSKHAICVIDKIQIDKCGDLHLQVALVHEGVDKEGRKRVLLVYA
jgi:hypothetical protein